MFIHEYNNNNRYVRNSFAIFIVSNRYVKINHPPYLTTIDLWNEIDDDTVKMVYDDGEKIMTIQAKKTNENQPWDDIVSKDDKDTVSTRRIISIEARTAKDTKLAADKLTATKEQARQSMRAQMDMEDKQRRRLENVKEEQKKEAEAEVFATLAKLQQEEETNEKQIKNNVYATSGSSQNATVTNTNTNIVPGPTTHSNTNEKNIFAPSSSDLFHTGDEEDDGDDLMESKKNLPPPRSRGVGVQLQFTGRAFPTPLRESKRKDEDDWLARNYVKLQQQRQQQQLQNSPGPKTPFVEKDPTWLKSKGDEFFRNQDYDSAINAYTAALANDSTSVPCLLNRAACYVQKFNTIACIQDCDAVLDKLSSTETNVSATVLKQKQQQLIKAFVRRITALVMEGKYSLALNDARKAVLLDDSLEDTIARLSSMTTAANFKETGDKLSLSIPVTVASKPSENDQHLTKAALKSYSDALNLEPMYIVVYLNRSALYMKLERFTEASKDCQRVLDLLDGKIFLNAEAIEPEPENETDEQDNDTIKPVPPKGSQLYQQIYQRANARILECKTKLENLNT